jgi:hypothetical protein
MIKIRLPCVIYQEAWKERQSFAALFVVLETSKQVCVHVGCHMFTSLGLSKEVYQTTQLRKTPATREYANIFGREGRIYMLHRVGKVKIR